MVRRKDRRRGKDARALLQPEVEGDDRWFTVSEAANVLSVPVTKIFDSIRDGRVRVRFHVDKAGDAERPLVSSDELIRRASVQAGTRFRSLPLEAAEAPASGSRESAVPAEPEPPAVDPPAAHVEVGESAAPATNGNGVKKNKNKTVAAKAAPKEVPAVTKSSAQVNGTSTATAEQKAPEVPAATEQQPAPAGLAADRASLSLAEKTIDRERSAREAAERKVEQLHVELREAVQQAEKVRGDEAAARLAAEQKLVLAQVEVSRLQQKHEQLEEELDRIRGNLEQTEDRMGQSLEVVYERDVKVARLESELQAAAKIQESEARQSGELVHQITRLETRSEEKEKEIRRLALGLGEARGEIRLLRPPVDETEKRFRLLKKLVPLLVLFAGSTLAGWIALELAAAQQRIGAAVVAGAGVFLAFLFGQMQVKSRKH
jgi:hypothetical protein